MGADQGRSRASAASEFFLFSGALLPALPEADSLASHQHRSDSPCSSIECPMGLQGPLGPLLWREHFSGRMLGAKRCGFQHQLPGYPWEGPLTSLSLGFLIYTME